MRMPTTPIDDFYLLQSYLRDWLNGGPFRSNDAAVDEAARRWAGRPLRRLLDSISPRRIRAALASPPAASVPPRRLLLNTLSPTEFRRRAAALEVHYGRVPSPFGEALLGVSEEGICLLSFPSAGSDDRSLLHRYLPGTRLCADPVSALAEGRDLFHAEGGPAVRAWVAGTPFQIRVWQTLARVPAGQILGYAQLAERVGRPRAARAVGSAMARNPLAWLIPCHRVVRGDGSLGHYQSDPARKAAMLAWEQAMCRGSRITSPNNPGR